MGFYDLTGVSKALGKYSKGPLYQSFFVCPFGKYREPAYVGVPLYRSTMTWPALGQGHNEKEKAAVMARGFKCWTFGLCIHKYILRRALAQCLCTIAKARVGIHGERIRSTIARPGRWIEGSKVPPRLASLCLFIRHKVSMLGHNGVQDAHIVLRCSSSIILKDDMRPRRGGIITKTSSRPSSSCPPSPST